MRTEAQLAARMADQPPRLVPTAPAQERPVVILGVAASDPHVVANHLIAMHLRDSGFDVINLGACTPVEEFVEAWQRQPDALAILIGSLNGHAAEDLAGLGDLKRDYQVRCPVIVGGNLSVGANKTGDEAARLLADGVDAVLTDADQIVPHLNALLAARDAAVIHA